MRSNKLTSGNCFANRFPEIAKDWNYNKNGNLTPQDFSYGSHKKVWWKCHICGWEWETGLSRRTILKRCCPNRKCTTNISFQYFKKYAKENNLQEMFPEIAKQWHPTKNRGLNPDEVSGHSQKMAWWVCDNGHEYLSKIGSRTEKHRNGCPYCDGKKVSVTNNLMAINPVLSMQWDYVKNKELTPKNVTSQSHKKVWWICDKKHSWKSSINDRSNGGGCPYCSKTNKKVCIDNCLATLYPHLIKEWHKTKNEKLTPFDVAPCSGKKYWWACDNQHEWEASPSDRVLKNSGCPYCNGVVLKNGALCNSLPEAIKYIEYKKKKLIFEHNKIYHIKLGKCRYDFFLPLENKYVEVTSYDNNNLGPQHGRYFRYLRNIVKKRRFVQKVLKAKFEFIQFTPTRKQLMEVREWKQNKAGNIENVKE